MFLFLFCVLQTTNVTKKRFSKTIRSSQRTDLNWMNEIENRVSITTPTTHKVYEQKQRSERGASGVWVWGARITKNCTASQQHTGRHTASYRIVQHSTVQTKPCTQAILSARSIAYFFFFLGSGLYTRTRCTYDIEIAWRSAAAAVTQEIIAVISSENSQHVRPYARTGQCDWLGSVCHLPATFLLCLFTLQYYDEKNKTLLCV